jgi:hypothetical protein
MFFIYRITRLGLRSPIVSSVHYDIESVCDGKSTLQLLADDVKIYSSVELHDHPNSLQLSIDRLSAWANQWQLIINIGKC